MDARTYFGPLAARFFPRITLDSMVEKWESMENTKCLQLPKHLTVLDPRIPLRPVILTPAHMYPSRQPVMQPEECTGIEDIAFDILPIDMSRPAVPWY